MKKGVRNCKISVIHLIQQNIYDAFNLMKCFGEMKMTKFQLFAAAYIQSVELIIQLMFRPSNKI